MDGLDDVTRWAVAARDGDVAAAAAFVRATQPQVWRLCAHLADPQAADDLTQETYLRAWAALPRFDVRSSARTWLLSIARRTVADHIRTVRRRRRLAGRLDPREPVDTGAETAVVVADLLAVLEPRRRAAFVLTQLEGLSYEEAAAVCHCPVGTIRSRVARARDDLVRLLGEQT